jgi:hypothetical protein
MTALTNAVFLYGAVLSLSGAAMAQTQERSGSQANLGPQVGIHLSRGRADVGEADTEAIAREKARAMVGNIKQPVMKPRWASVLACKPRQKTVRTAVFRWFCLHRCESLGQAASRPIPDDQSEKRNRAAP